VHEVQAAVGGARKLDSNGGQGGHPDNRDRPDARTRGVSALDVRLPSSKAYRDRNVIERSTLCGTHVWVQLLGDTRHIAHTRQRR
jgi:hypothetical protein